MSEFWVASDRRRTRLRVCDIVDAGALHCDAKETVIGVSFPGFKVFRLMTGGQMYNHTQPKGAGGFFAGSCIVDEMNSSRGFRAPS